MSFHERRRRRGEDDRSRDRSAMRRTGGTREGEERRRERGGEGRRNREFPVKREIKTDQLEDRRDGDVGRRKESEYRETDRKRRKIPLIKKEGDSDSSSPFPFCENIRDAVTREQHKLSQIDSDLRSYMRNAQPDLDLIYKKGIERKKLLRSLKKLRREGYRRESWKSRSASEVRKNIEGSSNCKGSFIIEDIFKSLDDTKEHFGKFGTIQVCEDLKVDSKTRKVKLEYFKKADAGKALMSRHPEGINFYIDPFPEVEQNNNPPVFYGNIKIEDGVLDTSMPQLSQNIPGSDQLNSNSQSLPGINRNQLHISAEDFTANAVGTFSINVSNHKYLLRTEQDFYEYFKHFGDILSIKYDDGSDLREECVEDRNIRIEYQAGHSLLLAVNSNHGEMKVTVPPECQAGRLSESPGRRYEKSGGVRDQAEETGGGGGGWGKKGELGANPGRQRMRKVCAVPEIHRNESWRCRGRNCNYNNSSREKLRCGECGAPRPGNWYCDKCGELNTIEKLACYRRSCGTIRRGNWQCSRPHCGTLNWSRSLHCTAPQCEEAQPGSWTCETCGELNFKDNRNCYRCKTRSVVVSQSYHHKDFEISAEQAKQREALENIRKRSSLNDTSVNIELQGTQPGHSVHINPCPTERREEGKDWGRQLRELGQERKRKLADENKRNKIVQNKLLALVGETTTQAVNLGGEIEIEKERPEFNKNPNLEPLATRKKSRLDLRKEHVGVLDDNLIEKIRHGSEVEKQEILKKFNIVEIQSPKPKQTRNVVEINLIDDSDEDIGKYSDGEAAANDEEIEVIGGKCLGPDMHPVRGKQALVNNSASSKCDEYSDDEEIIILEN